MKAGNEGALRKCQIYIPVEIYIYAFFGSEGEWNGMEWNWVGGKRWIVDFG